MGLEGYKVFELFCCRGGIVLKPLLIIKTGRSFSSLCRQHGDFDDFILSQLQVAAQDAIVVPVYETRWLPALDAFSGVIITGSHAMVTDREEWSEYLAAWLRAIPTGALPVLGICYGHQLLAHAFGGEVGYHPRGMEIGMVDIHMTEEGRRDSLLGCLDNPFFGYVTHRQTVITLPAGAKLLAKNDFEPHHAFVIRENMWGVQFHPEFTAAITQAYINEQSLTLIREGHDLEKLREMVKDHPFGKMLLQRFLKLVRSGEGVC
jgi:GMP synthase (glutamine-hydrolysing)